MADYPGIQGKAGRLQTFSGPGVTGVEHRHIILFCHPVDGCEKRGEIFLRVDVFLPMGGKKDISAFFQPKPFMDIRGFNLCQIIMQDLRHGRSGHIRPLFREAAVRQVPAGMLGIRHVHVRNNVHDPAVGLLWQALVLAPVSRLHVEDGNMEPLGADDR